MIKGREERLPSEVGNRRGGAQTGMEDMAEVRGKDMIEIKYRVRSQRIIEGHYRFQGHFTKLESRQRVERSDRVER